MILCNQQFGQLTTLFPIKLGKRLSGWKCKCSCGNTHEVLEYYLEKGLTKSCRHCYLNLSHPLAYNSWRAINSRCYNPKDKNFHNYGGRGIIVSKPWQEFINFINDMKDPPILNGKRLTIDRLDVNGNYEKSNCRWATSLEQSDNKRISNNLKLSFTIL